MGQRSAARLEVLVHVDEDRETVDRDALTGTSAVIGGGEACFAWKPEQTALAAKFVLRAPNGSGVVVSQLYAR